MITLTAEFGSIFVQAITYDGKFVLCSKNNHGDVKITTHPDFGKATFINSPLTLSKWLTGLKLKDNSLLVVAGNQTAVIGTNGKLLDMTSELHTERIPSSPKVGDLTYGNYWKELLSWRQEFVANDPLWGDKLAASNTHFVCTGRQSLTDLPKLLGPTKAESILTQDEKTKKRIVKNHLICWNRGGEVKIFKLRFNPVHVVLSKDSLTVLACGSRECAILDLEV